MLKLITILLAATLANTHAVQLNLKPYVLQNSDGSQTNTAITTTKPSNIVAVINEVVTTVIAMLSNLVKNLLVFTLNNMIVVFVSSLITIALCNYTSACTYVNSVTPFRQIEVALKYLATPNRIMQIADFVHDAIKKYSEIENEDQ
ncbi:uncharacterized protein LOC115444151 isoform X1 [Manduca sexta]|uniref:uncharacterized protein LOC115444151 isoform X1 n=1 Tax=Manduca sexta TaxID=7130 RepID=UPI00188FF227|nr:uncharacterized protein LOC115444151 isoform X1 [Manduca sexta]